MPEHEFPKHIRYFRNSRAPGENNSTKKTKVLKSLGGVDIKGEYKYKKLTDFKTYFPSHDFSKVTLE